MWKIELFDIAKQDVCLDRIDLTDRSTHKGEIATKYQTVTTLHGKSVKSVKSDYFLAKKKCTLKIYQLCLILGTYKLLHIFTSKSFFFNK